MSFGAAACRDTQIRAYSVPKEKSRAAAPEPQMAAPTDAQAPVWELPAGWQQTPGTGMRYATIVVEAGETPLEIRVTPLAMAAGEIVGNVNRWRGQIGLEPMTAAQVASVVKSFDVDGHPVQFVNLTGVAQEGAPPQQILAAMLTSEPRIWFFFMVGDAKRVAKYEAPFETFLRSVRLTGAPPVAQSMPPAGEMPPGLIAPPGGASGETMTWTAPKEWTQDPRASDMRVASFKLPGAGGEVTITRFPGDVGGLLANINRWRRQLSMDPVTDPGEQPSESVSVAGQPARFYDIAPPGADGARNRMMVVLLGRPDMTWFIKMTGPAALLDQQAGAFREFLGTVRLEGAPG